MLKMVSCESIYPDSKESPYCKYEEVQSVLNSGKKHTRHQEYKVQFQFLLSHCSKSSYYLHFKKCNKKDCTHCTSSPINYEKAFEALKEFNGKLPYPLLFENYCGGKHYPSFLDLTTNQELRNQQSIKEAARIKEEKKKENVVGSLSRIMINESTTNIANNKV